MEWTKQIARSPGLAVADPHYTWAGTMTIAPGDQGQRVVEVTLPEPKTLQWTAFLSQADDFTAGFKLEDSVILTVGIGVTRARVTAAGDLLGTYTGQVVASTLNIDVASGLTPASIYQGKVRVDVVVGYGTAPAAGLPAPSASRVHDLAPAGPGPDAITIRPTWRHGLYLYSPTTSVGDSTVTLHAPRSGAGQSLTLRPGQMVNLPGFCGAFSVSTPAGAFCSVVEW